MFLFWFVSDHHSAWRMRREAKIISQQNRLGIVSDYFQTRLQSCNDVLAENRVDKSVTDLRRIYRLIMTKDLEPDEAERVNFRRALLALEDYILSYQIDELKRKASKDCPVVTIDFSSFANQQELNEAFLDECWDFSQEDLLPKIKAFLENKAEFTYVDRVTNLTAFHYASQSDDPQVLNEFLSRGADPNQKYDDGYTRTIWVANHSNNPDKLKLFLEHGANISECDQNGNTVLHSLARFGDNIQCAKLLIEKGADVNQANKYGQTPIFNAIKYSNVDCLSFLIDQGATLNREDMFNDTPLLLAVNSNNAELVKILVSRGADKDYRNKHGVSALDVALQKGSTQVARALRQSTPNSATDTAESKAESSQKVQEKFVGHEDDGDDDIDRLKERIIESLKKGLIYLHDITSSSFNSSMDINVKYEDGAYVETTYFNSNYLDDDDDQDDRRAQYTSRSLNRYFEEDDDDTVIITDEEDVVIVGKPYSAPSNDVIKIKFTSDQDVLEYLYDLNYNYFCYLNMNKSELEVYKIILNKISTF